MHTSAAPAQEWSLDASSIDDRGSKMSVTAGRAHVGELEMYYEIHAEGKPLALLHSAIGTIDSCFRELLPALASIRQVIAVELQGHGHTADVDRPLTYGQMAEDTAALLRALGIQSADFVGYRRISHGPADAARGTRSSSPSSARPTRTSSRAPAAWVCTVLPTRQNSRNWRFGGMPGSKLSHAG